MAHGSTKVLSGTASSTKAGLSDGMGVTVYALNFINGAAAVSYVQIFNRPAASVTVGTTAPLVSIGIPASAGLTLPFPEGWVVGGDGFTISSTTTRAGSSTAAVDYNFWV